MPDKEITEYDVLTGSFKVEDSGPEVFKDLVNRKIQEGWQPHGAVGYQTVVKDDGDLIDKYLGSPSVTIVMWQAMVRFSDNTDQHGWTPQETAMVSLGESLKRQMDDLLKEVTTIRLERTQA